MSRAGLILAGHAPIVSTECSYDLDAVPPVRDCTTFNVDGEATLRVIREYANDTVPCGYPCVTGGVPTAVNTGDHFDAARRSIVETASFEPGSTTPTTRIVFTLDEFGNVEETETFDGGGNPTGSGTTTYTGDPAQPATFETRASDNTLISSGSLTWNGDQLEAFEITLNVGFIAPSRFDYEYNADGSLMKVTWFDIEQNPEELTATFDFAYPFRQATVTTVLPDLTVRSIVTYDFVCGP